MTIVSPTTSRPGRSPDPVGLAPALPELPELAVDLYRDIHKGIRAELFAVTSEAGATDPADDVGRSALASHVDSVAWLLTSHAEHEDGAIDPVLQLHRPDLAETIAADHDRFEHRFASIVDIARSAVDAGKPHQRRLVHLAYLELAGFTSAYLAHQDLEERVVMPALEAAVGPEGALAIHVAIVSTMPPEDLMRSLAVMLPAMNLDDRVELLAGMRADAPPEAFQAVLGLTRSVLAASDAAAVAGRLEVVR